MISESALVDHLQFVHLPDKVSVEDAVRTYRSNPNVLYAEPNYIVHALVQANDPLFSSQWGLQNNGQSGGTPGADIHATQAWNLTTGSSSVVVAVLDTGVDYKHQDLAANIWTAPNSFIVTTSSTPVNCPAGSRGFNAFENTCDPLDDNAHGSHVSGTIGAVGNNGIGVAGVNWNVQILPCKFLDINGNGDESSAITCLGLIKQLKDSGINIIATNNSWGGGPFSQALQDAITAQMKDGILFIAAAGNDFSDNDQLPFYPASFSVPNIISVAATTRTDDIAGFSNDGLRTVHLGAPGNEILSTTPNNTYSVFSGTSMAAPHVTGVAALLKAHDATLDWRGIKNLILAGGDPTAALADTITQKRLNAFGSLTCSNSHVVSRLLPVPDVVSGSVGMPITLSALNINCAQPAGTVSVQVSPGGQTVTLVDDGTGVDQASGDGTYTGQWTPQTIGSYTLTFPDGSVVSVEVLQPYGNLPANFNYVSITGTNLDMGDDSVAQVNSPFPIQFGGGSFGQLYISSNGTISFTEAFGDYFNWSLNPLGNPTFTIPPTTLVAPFWQDLYPMKGTQQNVFWQVTGTAPTRELVVEWRNVRSFQCRSDASATITFEAVFKESSGDILFNYGNLHFGDACSTQDFGGQASIGVQIAPGVASSWSFRDAKTASNSTLLWQSPPPTLPTNPIPSVTSISPTTVTWYGPSFQLTVSGSGFTPFSIVELNTVERPTTFVSSSQVVASIPASDLDHFQFLFQTGPDSISVFNPAPGGGTSNSLPLALVNPVPVITSISPTGATAGGLSFTMTMNGSGFVFGATGMQWNGVGLADGGVVNPTQFIAELPYSLITNPGVVQITLTTNGPGGGTSNSVPFAISAHSRPASPGTLVPQRFDPSSKNTLTQPPPRPIQFRGWKYARKQGPAYLEHFSRPYGLGDTPSIPSASTPMARVNRFGTPAAPMVNQPASMAGFALRPTLPAGFIPSSVATGDFNRDGKMDYVVANGGSNDIWIYFGNGDGTFQLPVIIPLTGSSPLWVAAADLRKIGILDLVVAEADSGSIGVLLGKGDGTFAPEATFYCPGAPVSLAIADFDGDGKLDIVAGLAGDALTGPLAFFKGDGTGKFGRAVTRPTTTFIGAYYSATLSVSDLNKDGIPDLVVVDEAVLAGIHSFLGQGDGTFKDAEYVAESGDFNFYSDAVAADMNEDGCPDIVGIHLDAGVVIFTGNCDGSFQGFPNVFGTGSGDSSVGLAVIDMDGDGHLDVVTSGVLIGAGPPFGYEAGDLVTVLKGDGKGNLGLAQVFRGDPSMFSLAVADINGDGHPDVITANQDTDSTSVYLNDGKGGLGGPTGGFIGYTNGGASNAPVGNVIVRDVDGDGKPDLTVMEFPQFSADPWDLAVMLNDGTGKFGPPIRSSVVPVGVSGFQIPIDYLLADFRNTGKPDLLSLATGGDSLNPQFVFAPNVGGGHFGPPQSTPNGLQSSIVMNVGDFDKDGKLDVVVVGDSGSQPVIASFKGNGDGTFLQKSITAIPVDLLGSGLTTIYVGDFNKDGKLDLLLGGGYGNSNVYELLGNGDGTFAPPRQVLSNIGFYAVADVNHDGLPDIVAYDGTQGPINPVGNVAVTIYLCQPDGTFLKGQIYQPYAGEFFFYTFVTDYSRKALSPLVADFNGDGNLDIALFQDFGLTGGGLTYAQMLLGNGDGTFTPTYVPINFDKFFVPFTAADVNGDGRADLIELNGWPASYHVILAAPGPTFQAHVLGNPVVGSGGKVRITLNAVSASSNSLQLTPSDPLINITTSATVPAGSATVDVPFAFGSGFNAKKVFTINAQLGTEISTAYGVEANANYAVGFHVIPLYSVETIPPGGTTADYMVELISFGGYTTTAHLSCQGLPPGAVCQYGSTQVGVNTIGVGATSLLIQTGSTTPVGSYPIQLIATDGSVSDQFTVTLNVDDFSLALSPTSQSISGGSVAMYDFTVNPIAGWSDVVHTTCTVTPSVGGVCSADQNTFGTGTQPISIQSQLAAQGDYTVSITATGESITHQTSATFHVLNTPTPDFSVSLSPTSLTITQGAPAGYTLTIGPINGWTSAVKVSCSVSPSKGGICSADGLSLMPGIQQITVGSQSAPPGTYTVTLSATGNGTTHQTTATLDIPGISVSLSSNSATIPVGSSANFSVTMNSQVGVTGQYTFSCLGLVQGVSCGFNPPSGTLPPNGSLGTVITVTVSSRPTTIAPPAHFEDEWWQLFGLMMALMFCAFVLRKLGRQHYGFVLGRDGIRVLVFACLLVLLIPYLEGCNGGGGGSAPPPPPVPAVVNITIQATSTGAPQNLGSISITVP